MPPYVALKLSKSPVGAAVLWPPELPVPGFFDGVKEWNCRDGAQRVRWKLALSRGRCEHCSDTSPGKYIGCGCANRRDIGLHVSGGQCKDSISVKHRMHWSDGSSQPIVCHGRDSFRLGLIELRIGGYDRERR